MSKIIWLSSYPKSGNTWVRFILAHLLGKKIEASGDVYRLIPDIHKGITAQHLLGRRTVFIKSHLKYFDAMPLREDTLGAVYIVRHPLDVMASAINYLRLRDAAEFAAADEAKREEMQQAFLTEFLEKGGPERWIRLGMGSWPEHVESWHRRDLPFPRFTLKYEDLKRRPAESLEPLCRFLQLERSKEQIEAALAAASFERMREMEETELAEGRPGIFAAETPSQAFALGYRFMSRGTMGGHSEALTDAQRERARRLFEPVMAKFGYE